MFLVPRARLAEMIEARLLRLGAGLRGAILGVVHPGPKDAVVLRRKLRLAPVLSSCPGGPAPS